MEFKVPDLATLLKGNDVSQDVQRHLARVYAAVGVNVLAAAAAAAATIALDLTSWNTLFAVLTLAAVWPLMSMPPSPARSAVWVAFGALEGASLGGFVSQLNALDPSIVPKALVGTAIIFACFSGAAMLSPRRSYLYLGGALSSGLTLLLCMSVANLFLSSAWLFTLDIYGGLFLFIGYVIFDTQLIIERASVGVKDVIRDALGLFMDLLNMFIRVAIMLAQNAERREKRKAAGSNKAGASGGRDASEL